MVFAGEARGHYLMGQGGANAGGLCWRRWKSRCRSRISRCLNRLFLKPRFRLRLFRNRDSPRILPRRYPGHRRHNRGFEIFSDSFFDGESGVIETKGDARLGGRVAHEYQRAGFYRRQMRIAICRSSDELRRRFYENSVKFTRLAATNGILTANPASFE